MTGIQVVQDIAGDLSGKFREPPLRVGVHRRGNYYDGTTIVWSFGPVDCGVTIQLMQPIEDLVRDSRPAEELMAARTTPGRHEESLDQLREAQRGENFLFRYQYHEAGEPYRDDIVVVQPSDLFSFIARAEEEGRAIFFIRSPQANYTFPNMADWNTRGPTSGIELSPNYSGKRTLQNLDVPAPYVDSRHVGSIVPLAGVGIYQPAVNFGLAYNVEGDHFEGYHLMREHTYEAKAASPETFLRRNAEAELDLTKLAAEVMEKNWRGIDESVVRYARFLARK